MRKFLLILLCLASCLLAPTVRAAGPTGSIQSGQILRGRFIQTRHLQGFDAPLKTDGHFVLAPSKGLIWRAETPFAMTTVITATELTQMVGDTQTMHLRSATLPFLSQLYETLTGALAGDWRGMNGEFDVVQSGNGDAWTVVLTPRKGPNPLTMPFQSITAKGGRFVTEVDIARPNGDSEVLQFTDQSLAGGPLTNDEAGALSGPRK